MVGKDAAGYQHEGIKCFYEKKLINMSLPLEMNMPNDYIN